MTMPIKIQIPGSKSITNRALILAALSEDTTILKNAAVCDDSLCMINALKKLGIKIHQKGETIKITGVYKNNKLNFLKQKKQIPIYTGNAGTTTRFLTALAALTGNKVTIDGDERMRQRPIKDLTDALNKLGAKITTTNGHLPICVHKKLLKGGKISLPGNISSQYLTAILLTAPSASQKTTINIEQKLYSRPYIEMTLKVLKSFKINIKNKKNRQFIVEPMKRTKSTHSTKTYKVESDTSSASYIGAYVALHPNKTILLKNIHKNSIQGDIKFLYYLKKIGCKTIEQKNGTLIEGTHKLKSLRTIDMNETPDIVMTFAVLALFTKGKTKIKNIGNLRIKETNRINALKNELKKLGAKVKTGKDWIEIENLSRQQKIDLTDSKKKIAIETYNDHRIAMSFGILTDIFRNLSIKNPNCVSKSYTTFWKDIKKITIKNMNIVLTGLRGSGKTKIGMIISKHLGWNFIDTDKEIEREENKTIKEIIELHGWKYFRKKEQNMAEKIGKLDKTVIATGGGLIINKENEKALKKTGKIIYLHEKPEICAQRILNSNKRPPLTDKKSVEEEMKHLYKQRNGRYRESADIILNRTDNKEDDAKKIIDMLFES